MVRVKILLVLVCFSVNGKGTMKKGDFNDILKDKFKRFFLEDDVSLPKIMLILKT